MIIYDNWLEVYLYEQQRKISNTFNKINQYNSGEIGITRIAYTNEEQTCTHAFMRMCKDER